MKRKQNIQSNCRKFKGNYHEYLIICLSTFFTGSNIRFINNMMQKSMAGAGIESEFLQASQVTCTKISMIAMQNITSVNISTNKTIGELLMDIGIPSLHSILEMLIPQPRVPGTHQLRVTTQLLLHSFLNCDPESSPSVIE